MKVKLLRKVRKRYSIEYFPYKGIIVLKDTKWPDSYRTTIYTIGERLGIDSVMTYDVALQKAKNTLWGYVLTDYSHLGIRRNKKSKKSIKLWYK